MTDLQVKDDAETEEFTDELSDEALDQVGRRAACVICALPCAPACRAGN